MKLQFQTMHQVVVVARISNLITWATEEGMKQIQASRGCIVNSRLGYAVE